MSGLMPATVKGSLLLAEIRRKYPSYHPILAIVDISMDKEASLDLQFNCHKTVAKYIEPELKSVEIKGDLKTVQTVRVSLFGQDEAETVTYQDVPAVAAPSAPATDSAVDDAIMQYEMGTPGGF